MAAVTEAETLEAVAERLKMLGVDQLASHWTGIVADAVADAVNDVSVILQLRGYSAAQVAAADQLASWTRRLALYYALTNGGVYKGLDIEAIKPLDIRGQARRQPILISGVIVTPAGSGGETVGSGNVVGYGVGEIFNGADDGDGDGDPTRRTRW